MRGGRRIDTDITIVIPAYNEERRLPATLDRLVAGLPTVTTGRWEIVVSDDGSTDDTVRVVRARAGSDVSVVSGGANQGKGAALRTGALRARYPLVLFLDADLPVPIETIPEMVAMSASADLVVGSRRLEGSSFDPPQPLVRRAGGRAFRAAVRGMGYRITSDPQCGVKLLRGDSMVPLLTETTCRGFGFDVELIERTKVAGLQVAELPVRWRHVEGSSLRPVRDAVRTLAELALLRSALQRRRAHGDAAGPHALRALRSGPARVSRRLLDR